MSNRPFNCKVNLKQYTYLGCRLDNGSDSRSLCINLSGSGTCWLCICDAKVMHNLLDFKQNQAKVEALLNRWYLEGETW